MKKFSIILILVIFLVGAKRTSDELDNSQNFEKSLLVWSKLLKDISERLSSLENDFQTKEKQQKEFNHNNVIIKESLANLNARMDKIEKMTLILDLKDTLESYEGTLDVFKERLSDIAKKLDDIEVKAAITEKIYGEHKQPKLVTSKEALDETVRIDTGITSETQDIAKVEKKVEVAKTKTKKEQPQIVKERSDEKVKRTISKELKGFKKIGNDFYVRNVTFLDYGSSSIAKGEIKNNSRNDISTALFTIKIFGEDSSVIGEFDFSVVNIRSGVIRPFEEMIQGLRSSEISKYEIVFKKAL